MAYEDLRDWMAALERAGELKTIRTPVNAILEIAEITDRVSKTGGPALLFQNIEGHQGSQVLINQFGSARRMNLALEVDSLDQVADRIRHFMDVKSPQGFLDKVKMLPMLAEMGKFFPKTVSTGQCKEVIKRDNFSLLAFPILQCWPKDAGRFITMPCVITRDPKSGKRNVGMYRMQVYDERTTGMHWQRQKIGAEHYREALRTVAASRNPGTGHVGTGDLARPAGNSAEKLYDEPTEADRYQMIRTYFQMLLEEGMPGAEGKMKQFASWFTHGVPGGAALRKAIYEAKSGAEILARVESFFESRVQVPTA